MRELMVPLLLIAMTGMVIGQQPAPSGSNDLNPSFARPQPDDDVDQTNTQTSNRQDFGQQQTASANEVLRWLKNVDVFEVKLDPVSLNALRKGQQLSAGFVAQDQAGNQLPKDSIRAITARDSRVDSSIAPPIPIQGRVITNEQNERVIAFGLSRAQVEDLANGQFVFEIPEQELGTYDVVALVPTFDEPITAPPAFQPLQGNGFEGTNQFAQDNRNRAGSNDSLLPPLMPNRSVLESQNADNSSSSQFDNSIMSKWEMPQQRDPRSVAGQNNVTPSNPAGGSRMSVFPPNSQSQASNSTNPPGSMRRLTTNSSATESMLLEMKQQFNDLQSQQRVQELRRQQTEQDLLDEIEYLKSERQRFRVAQQQPRNQTARGNAEARPVSFEREARRPGLDAASSVDLSNTPPNQAQRTNLEQSNASLAAGVGNALKNQAGVSQGGNEGVLFILFLFSLAGNLYLGMLCRSLYARYGVLADELRETFTGSL